MLTMKMRTRVFSLALLFGLLLAGLTACAPGPASAPGAEPTVAAEAQPVNPAPVNDETPSDSSPAPARETLAVFECTDTNPHPLGQSITETYDVSYEQVMTWFCDDFTFDDILIALETGEAMDISASVLLEMRVEKTWTEIWSEIGLTQE
jgi:hypothetical protein